MQSPKGCARVGPDTSVDPDQSMFPSRLVLHFSHLSASKSGSKSIYLQRLPGWGKGIKLETNQNKTLRPKTASFCDLPALLLKHRCQCYINGALQTYGWRVPRGSLVHSYQCRLHWKRPVHFYSVVKCTHKAQKVHGNHPMEVMCAKRCEIRILK